MAIAILAWVAASIVMTALLARVFCWLRGARPIETDDEMASMGTRQAHHESGERSLASVSPKSVQW